MRLHLLIAVGGLPVGSVHSLHVLGASRGNQSFHTPSGDRPFLQRSWTFIGPTDGNTIRR